MVKIKFIYMNNKYEINENGNTLLIEILKKYCRYINNDINDFYFLYKGKKLLIDNKLKIKQIILRRNNNTIIISVFNLRKYNNRLNNLICPDCGNLSLINFLDDKIIIDCYIKNHKNVYLSVNNLISNQNDYNSKIKCNICMNNEYLYKEQFYICSCEKLICGICYNVHNNNNHNLIKYWSKYSNCITHNKGFTSYCSICGINLCPKCEDNHRSHKIILYKEIILKEIGEDLDHEINNIEEYKNNLLLFNKIFNHFIINKNIDLNSYVKLYEKISWTFDNLKNYESIRNIINCGKYHKLNKEISYFLKENIKNKFRHLIDVYDKNKESMIIEYFNDKYTPRLFGEIFVKKNINNCYLIINNQLSPLKEFHYGSGYLKIILFKTNNLNDLSYMFYGCENLLSLEFHKWDSKNIINMSHMFFGCKSLKKISHNYRWNIDNLNDISCMFAGCSSLIELPDISNWNTSNIKNISMLFFCCNSLSVLPDISKWSLKNVEDFNSLFYGCKSLITLPDISKWDTSNVANIQSMLYGCKRLKYLPDISKWNLINIKDMKQMFSYCESLKSLPDISGWDTSKVSDMSEMFLNCKLLSGLPSISKWKTSNVIDMSYMFSDCESLISLPDISYWDVSNVYNMYKMFYNCKNLLSFPDISKWNTHNVTNISFMFAKCISITEFPEITKWNINNVENMSFLFDFCQLLSVPDISSWNLDNVIHKSFLFSDYQPSGKNRNIIGLDFDDINI